MPHHNLDLLEINLYQAREKKHSYINDVCAHTMLTPIYFYIYVSICICKQKSESIQKAYFGSI